jgi:hypothetical protein
MISGLLLKIMILNIMNGRKNIILEQKVVNLNDNKKFLYCYLIFEKKGDTPYLTSNKTIPLKEFIEY